MVLRNSGRVGSRRFFQREAPVSEDAGAFLFLSLWELSFTSFYSFDEGNITMIKSL